MACSFDLSCTSDGNVNKEKGSSMSCPSLSSSSSLDVAAGGLKNGLLGEFEKGSIESAGGGRKNEESLGASGGASMWSGRGTERNCCWLLNTWLDSGVGGG